MSKRRLASCTGPCCPIPHAVCGSWLAKTISWCRSRPCAQFTRSTSSTSLVPFPQSPRQAAREVSQVVDALARRRKMSERGGEHSTRLFGEAPRQRKPEVRTLRATRRQVEFVVGYAQQDARIGSQLAELVHLVVPAPRGTEMPHRRMVRLEHIEGERLRPRVPVEASPDELSVLAPAVTRIGGGVNRDDRDASGAHGIEQCGLLRR